MQFVRLACLTFLFGQPLAGQLQFVNPNTDWSNQPPAIASDAFANTYIVSNTLGAAGITVTKRDLSNGLVYSFAFADGQEVIPLAAAADSLGSLWIAGWTNSAAYPLVKPLLHPLVPDAYSRAPLQGFLAKVDATGSKLLFSTLVGGNDPAPPFATQPFGFTTAVTALAVDVADNVYVVGATTSPTFPVSANAFQKTGGGLSDPTQTDNSDVRMSSFVMKISSGGNALLYSTYLGGQTRVCAIKGACSVAMARAVAVDSQGRATVAGVTLQPDFPVTAGAYQTDCRCGYAHSTVFVSRFRADGSGLEWSTFMGDSDNFEYNPFSSAPGCDGLCVAGMVLDRQGNAIVAGATRSTTFPVTSGAIQGTYPVIPDGGITAPTAGFVSVIGSDGSSLLHSTYFGGTSSSLLNGVTQDSAGNLWITGQGSSAGLPQPAGSMNLGTDYVAELDPSLSRVLRYSGMPKGAAGASIHDLPNHSIVLTGASNAVLALPEVVPPGPSVWGVAGAAEAVVTMHVAPGEVISLYGSHLGPASTVLVNGIPAPVLYAGANQINLVVPFAIAASSGATIQVTTSAGTNTVAGLQVDSARPQIFPVIVNQDGSINSTSNPAPRGSIVTMWATGGGAMDTGMVDGAVNQPPLGKPLAPVSVHLSRLSPSDSGEVTYAGAAPGMIAGVLQINFRVPAAHSGYGSCHFDCAVVLGVGTIASPLPDPRLIVPD